MWKAITFAALVALATLAGCITPAAEDQLAAASIRAPAIEALGAVPVPAENVSANGTWFVVPISITPEAGLTAFTWSIPSGAIVPWGMNEVFDADESVVAIEIALVGAPEVDVWGMVFFTEENGKLETDAGYLAMGETSLLYTAVGGETYENELLTVDFATLGGDREEGEILYGLALARGPTPGDAAIAFRVLDRDPYYPDSDEEPAKSPESFVAARGNATPLAPPVLAAASGFEVHGYFDVLFGGLTPSPPSMIGVETIIGTPDVEWDAPPEARAMGGAHSFSGSAAGTLARGFDIADAGYLAISTGASQYAAAVTLHGEETAMEGRDVGLGFPGLLAGLAAEGGGVFAWGDGEGETGATLAMQRVMGDAFVASVGLGIFEFGATLEDLFGIPAKGGAEGGDYGGLPVTSLTPRGLARRSLDGPSWTYALPGVAALQNL